MPPPELKFLKNTAEQLWSHPTWDLSLIFAILAAGFFYGISAGKRRIAVAIIYTYVAFGVATVLPIADFSIRAGAFIAIFVLIVWLLGSRRSRGFAPPGSWWQIFLLSFLQVGFLAHLTLTFLPQEKIALLAPLTKNVFANPELHLWWMVSPIAVLVILKRLEDD